MKTAKRILTVALALMLIFALAAPSFAMVSANQPASGGASNYIQSTSTTYQMSGTFTVHLNIYSGQDAGYGTINSTYDITMGSAGVTKYYTVKDVLDAAAASSSGTNLSFTTSTNDYHDYYLQGVSNSNVGFNHLFEARSLKYNYVTYYCGWMFRINGMLPYYYPSGSSTPKACLISDAYVTADDTIDLYFANVYTQSLATKVRKVVYVTPASGSSYLQLLEAECYVPSGQTDWTLTAWAPVASQTVSIKVDGANQSVTTDANGVFTCSVSSGTHTFRFNTTTTQYSYKVGSTTYYYQVPAIVGMYSKISF